MAAAPSRKRAAHRITPSTPEPNTTSMKPLPPDFFCSPSTGLPLLSTKSPPPAAAAAAGAGSCANETDAATGATTRPSSIIAATTLLRIFIIFIFSSSWGF